jgi:uncharacterized protein
MRRPGDSLFGPAFPFYRLFQELGTRFAKSVSVLDTIFRDSGEIAEKCTRIQAIETEAEVRSREISRQLSLTLILPRDRDDIHDLNLAFANCIQAVKAVSTRVGLYGLLDSRGSVLELTANLVEIASHIERMLETMNRGRGVEKLARGVGKIRAEADRFLLVGLGELYEMPTTRPQDVLEVVKWSHVYDRLETVLNQAQHVAHTIEGVALKLQ